MRDDAQRSDETQERRGVDRVVVTAAAAALLRRLSEQHGPLMFHQSGGCCDGSSPMCYPQGDFVVGDRDVLLGVLDIESGLEPGIEPDVENDADGGVPVWISGPQFQAWKHTQLVIDVVPGRGGGFSLEVPEGVRFLSRGRAFRDTEVAALATAPVITGADYARGERPAARSPVVAEAGDVCRVPAGHAARAAR
ncbi:DUF779 domain-containing protein [Mycobacterium sp.]|uniref:DUF779 domain-containing protein n=1 Tax=Mycobacterium sp. TaxID=1785 RepID=UPI00128608A2|nr:DUF779 domain-containing protein [Mycobacterium sp.]KAA8966881.1 MAG: DUF779 domain-containing protein [Mycobacterium sp.]